MNNQTDLKTNRRGFIGSVASGAMAIGMSAIAAPVEAIGAADPLQEASPDAWFDKIKGKHKLVFDATQPNGIYPFAWPRVFLLTNEMTGTMAKDCSVVVVLRHSAFAYALSDKIWEKYKLGEAVGADDPATGMKALRNPFAKPKPEEYKVPGVGPVAIGINELQATGVMFCVCGMAMTVFSTRAAQSMKLDPAEVRKEWMAALLPEIQVVPSGVWALGRAQEHGCGYVFAG